MFKRLRKPRVTQRTNPAPSPEAIKDEQEYTLCAQDSLPAIAARHYGQARLWRSIFEHNRQVLGRNPRHIATDVTIKLPSLDAIIKSSTSRTQVLCAYEACALANATQTELKDRN